MDKDTTEVVAKTVARMDPIAALSRRGIRSGHAYTAGFLSIGMSLASWLMSRGKRDSRSQSDRWGIFVGEWAPTFFAVGLALKHDEKN